MNSKRTIVSVSAGVLALVLVAPSPVLPLARAVSYAVTNTNDTGPGSLRKAIDDANNNPGPDTIVFSIPTTDPGYNQATGVWTIQPTSPLPTLYGGTTIDGATQTESIGDKNPYGPEIELDGSNAGGSAVGLFIQGDENHVRGLVINRFAGAGVQISLGMTNTVAGCYIGTDPTSTVARGNAMGVYLVDDATGNTIGGATPGQGNLISGNTGSGVAINLSNTNAVFGNYIGTNAVGVQGLGNAFHGVHIDDGMYNSVSSNTIAYNGLTQDGNGVRVQEMGALYNTITVNSIHHNGGKGIALVSGGNTGLAAPVITSASCSDVFGTACPNCTVEIFSDGEDEGQHVHSPPYAFANAAGNWSWSGSITGPNVTATATDGFGNTSEFSTPWEGACYRIALPLVVRNFP